MLKVQEGSKAMIYLDVAARFALYQSLFELQNNGGLSSTSECGLYYDFAVWKDSKGKYCLPAKKDAEDSFKKYVAASLLGRLYKYPHADFITGFSVAPVIDMSTPEAAQQAVVEGTGVTEGAESHRCTGSYPDFTKQFTYRSSEKPLWFPENGVNIIIPKEGNCPGKLPMIVFFHGCHPGNLGSAMGIVSQMVETMKKTVKEGKSDPVILVVPTQAAGDGWQNSPNGACGPALWGSAFDLKKVVDEASQNLPSGITVSSVSFAGHSGAGCNLQGSLHKAAELYPNAYAFGVFDTCAQPKYAEDFKAKLRGDTKMMFIFASMKDQFVQQNELMGITSDASCPSPEVDVQNAKFKSCKASSSNAKFGYEMVYNNHHLAMALGMEMMLKSFFAPSSSRPPATGPSPEGTPGLVGGLENQPVQV
jgi:hypothetical protein